MWDIKDSRQLLVDCYGDQAEHFGNTRQKARPEFGYITPAIDTYRRSRTGHHTHDQCVLVDLGCGTGRLLPRLEATSKTPLAYTGVDIAPGMITHARKKYPQATWKAQEMLRYLASCEQESVDVVVAIATIQHLLDDYERELLFAQVYRVLRRGGIFLMTNWSYSTRFVRRYRPQQIEALIRSCTTHWKWNDLRIPRKDPRHQHNQKKFSRHYHMFTLFELQQLARLQGFIIRQDGYVQQDGTLSTTGRAHARNTRMWAQKDIYHKEY